MRYTPGVSWDAGGGPLRRPHRRRHPDSAPECHRHQERALCARGVGSCSISRPVLHFVPRCSCQDMVCARHRVQGVALPSMVLSNRACVSWGHEVAPKRQAPAADGVARGLVPFSYWGGCSLVLMLWQVPFEVLVRRQIGRLLDPALQCARFVYDELVKVRRACLRTGASAFRYWCGESHFPLPRDLSRLAVGTGDKGSRRRYLEWSE